MLVKLPTVKVSAGTFVMGSEGSARGGRDDERPRATHELHAFQIDVYEVTNAQYALFLGSEQAQDHSSCHPDEPSDKDHTPSAPSAQERSWGAVPDAFTGEGRAQHPVVGVDWFDAVAFSSWCGRRLPSEDEWERAARGTDGRRFPWGDAPPVEGDVTRANGNTQDPHPMTLEVGSLPEGDSLEGAHDLAGNVWEWTASPYLAYEGAPAGTPEHPAHYVVRGGGWSSASSLLLRGAVRDPRPRDFRSAAVGFRTVRDAE